MEYNNKFYKKHIDQLRSDTASDDSLFVLPSPQRSPPDTQPGNGLVDEPGSSNTTPTPPRVRAAASNVDDPQRNHENRGPKRQTKPVRRYGFEFD